MRNFINEEFQPYTDALVFDDKWTPFIEKCNDITTKLLPDQACETTGISFQLFTKVIDHAFSNWRDSPTTSILHGISYLKLGQTPHEGNAVFVDLAWQTRFLIKCREISPVFMWDMRKVFKNNKPIMVKNEPALTPRSTVGIYAANNVLRCLYLYWWLSSQTLVKLPKKIYRGIRAHDLFRHNTLAPAVTAIFATDKTHIMKRKQVIDLLIQWICQRKLHQITDGNILSFTASIPVAKYFSNGEGFILTVDPAKVDIISSELHDERLHGKDYMSNKNEREYIIRIPANYDFKPDDIIVNDSEYFIASENPLSVTLFHHDDKEAFYTMNGQNINAVFYWKNNNSGSLRFRTENWGGNRKEFQQRFGFDPLPNPNNLNQITNFVVKPAKNW